MKYLTLIALSLIPAFSFAQGLIAVEKMNLNGALHAIGSGDYQQFLKFGSSELKKKITKSEFEKLNRRLQARIVEGYTIKVIGSQRWAEANVITHFIEIQFRSPEHENYETMLLELITTPSGKKSFGSNEIGDIIDIRIRKPNQ